MKALPNQRVATFQTAPPDHLAMPLHSDAATFSVLRQLPGEDFPGDHMRQPRKATHTRPWFLLPSDVRCEADISIEGRGREQGRQPAAASNA